MTTPYYKDEFGEMYLGQSEEILDLLEPASVDMCMTSPPYWMARDYGVEGQLGKEPDYRDYINNLCIIFSKMKRVLKPTGNLFVNIGDKYFSKNVGTGGRNPKQNTNEGSFFEQKFRIVPLMPQGSLMDLPHRFAIKMVDDYGWILKHCLIWYKPNAFVTSNKRKFTLDFEYILHFVLSDKYYFEQQHEPFVPNSDELYRRKLRANKEYNLKEPYKHNEPHAKYKHNNARVTSQESPNRMWEDDESLRRQLANGRNKRSVWKIPTHGYKGAHIATYPVELISTPIKAGSPVGGVVLDPFMGSGTTAVACEQLGRKWLGIDNSKEYIDDAIERIRKERGVNE